MLELPLFIIKGRHKPIRHGYYFVYASNSRRPIMRVKIYQEGNLVLMKGAHLSKGTIYLPVFSVEDGKLSLEEINILEFL